MSITLDRDRDSSLRSERQVHFDLDEYFGLDYTYQYFRPEWRNWQTRTTQNRVSLTDMWVRFPPSASSKKSFAPIIPDNGPDLDQARCVFLGSSMRKLPLLLIILAASIGLGLFIGWVVWPVNFVENAPSELRSDWKDEAIWMAAQSFAFDGDLELAQTRLARLGSDDLGRLVLDRAERAIDQKFPALQIKYMARLAAAFGATSPRLDPYLQP
jgi:hypothetical protein